MRWEIWGSRQSYMLLEVMVCLYTASAYLSGCQGNKITDSERDDLPKKADDDPPDLVTRHCDVKKHLGTERERERERGCQSVRGVRWQKPLSVFST